MEQFPQPLQKMVDELRAEHRRVTGAELQSNTRGIMYQVIGFIGDRAKERDDDRVNPYKIARDQAERILDGNPQKDE